LTEDASLADVKGFSKHNMRFMSMIPTDEKIPAETIFTCLINENIIPPCGNMYDGFDEYRKHIRANYNHGEFFTSICPEDERLLYAAAKIANPKRAFAAGAYYGYFVVWAMKSIQENGGMCVLSDIDREACDLASANFDNLGYGNNARICCENAETLLLNRTEPIDLLILDAMGKGDDPRPEYRGKRIYAPLLKAARHCLSKGSVIVIHNMEPYNPEMKSLVDELQAINAPGTNYDAYNGLGVYVVS
jgi:predicted O-methyltransferase YrrM